MQNELPYNPSDAKSIFEHASLLIDKSLRMLYEKDMEAHKRKGKGGLGQMVEELHYHYSTNSVSGPDFEAAGIELKCTPLRYQGKKLAIKERLVCNMIDYDEVDTQPTLIESHFWYKCQNMLLLFYINQVGKLVCDLIFVYRVLWSFPEKDLLIIENDYLVIYNKIHKGLAHTLSEGDTMYLGACRKGQKGDSLRKQPHSDKGAKRRAFCLKMAYMRTILELVENRPDKSLSTIQFNKPELVKAEDLRSATFEKVILNRFESFYGKNYIEIADALGQRHSNAKHKYSLIANGIASNCGLKSIDDSEEFQKSGIRLKTVRLEYSGKQKESMAFKNIDYQEIMDCDVWEESDLYEIFTSRFMFVVFKQADLKKKIFINGKSENEYVLDKVFFWTMPQCDVDNAEEYWKHIRTQVINNNISLDRFWKIGDKKDFHVRPKSRRKSEKTANPHGGLAEKYCYWFNAQYVQSIIKSQDNNND